jgi:hypothetical protein
LLKEGNVRVSQWILFKPLYWPERGTSHGLGTFGGHPPPSIEYVLEKYDEASVRAILKLLAQSRPYLRGSLGVALRRFNSANERLKDEDRLLDLIIAMEALLLRGDEQNELGFRFALRGTALISDKKIRKEIFSNLKSAYDLRSRIVHGEREHSINKLLKRLREKNGLDMSLSTFTQSIENIARRLIVDYARLRRTVDFDEGVIAELDDRVLRHLT